MSLGKNSRLLQQLKQCGISMGIWIDAGCGRGTFTYPLASLVSQVIALDKNENNIKYLQSYSSEISNIIPLVLDFDLTDRLWKNLVDGVLFAFSLHYIKNPKNALLNAFNQLKRGGMIVIIEYSRKKPVPWVPFPYPIERMRTFLEEIGFEDIELVTEIKKTRRLSYWDNSSYILRGWKRKN